MSGPVSPPLTVKESDGSVSVRPTNTISFNAADFTVSGTGSEATISIDSTGTGAALTDTQIGFGNASNVMTSSADLTYTASSGTLLLQDADRATFQLKGTQTSDTTAVAQIAVSNAGDSTASIAFFRDGAADAMSIRFGTQQVGSTSVDERMRIANDGVITFTDDNSVQTTIFSGVKTGSDGTVVDLSFKNGSDSTAQIGVLRSGADDACDMIFGTQPAGGNVTERLRIASDGLLTLTSNTAGASNGPKFKLLRDITGADANEIGTILFNGQNDASAEKTYAMIFSEINDASAGTEDGWLHAGVMSGGTMDSDMLVIRGDAQQVVVNEGGSPVDFRVEGSSQANLLRTDSSQNNIGIATLPPSGHAGQTVRMTVQGDDDAIALMLQNDGVDADDGPEMVFYRNSSSPAADDLLGRIRFDGEDSGDNIHTYFRMTSQIKDPTDASEDGNFIMTSRQAGSLFDVVKFNGAVFEINPNGDAAVDTKIISDFSDAGFANLYADSSQNNIGLGTDSPASDVERLHIKGTGSADPLVRLESSDDDANAGPILELYRNADNPLDDDLIGRIEFSGNDSGGTKHVLASIGTILRDTAAGGEDAAVVFQASQFGSDTVEFLRYGLDAAQSNRQVVVNNGNNSTVGFLVKGSATAILSTDPSGNNLNINPNGNANVDMIVQGDTLTNLLRTDASIDMVGIGQLPTSSAGAMLQVSTSAQFYRETSNTFTANHDVTNDQAHGHVLVMSASDAANNTFTLPDAPEIGMHVTFVNIAGSNGMTIAVSASTTNKINGVGSAGSSSVSTTTKFQTITCHYVATDIWVATEPTIAA